MEAESEGLMASGHGGPRPGSGRKKGGSNRLTEEAVAQAKEGGILPLDYMLEVMRDVKVDETRRLDAAKAAAPYVHARLQPVDREGDTAQKVTVSGALAWQPPQQ